MPVVLCEEVDTLGSHAGGAEGREYSGRCRTFAVLCSRAAKRGSELAWFLLDHVLEEVPHAQWVFTIPKMLRPLFFRKRELRGVLARLAWQTVRELMTAAVDEPDLRPGMLSVIQTFGDTINPHPHVHALVSRGGWTRDDRFLPIPYVDPVAAQKLFRHKVFCFLLRKELISQQRVELLFSWQHSGFSVHNGVLLAPGDHAGVEALVRYMMRPPVSLARLKLLPGGDEVLHYPKAGGDDSARSRPRASTWSATMASTPMPQGASVTTIRPCPSRSTPQNRLHRHPPLPPRANAGPTSSAASTKWITSSAHAAEAKCA